MGTTPASQSLNTPHTWMAYINLQPDTDPLAGWPGLNLGYFLGKVDLLSHQEESHSKARHLQTWDQAPDLETAFLGPQFWDKKVSMKCGSEESGSSGYRTGETESESPSPPHFQQQVRREQDVKNLRRAHCRFPTITLTMEELDQRITST